MTRIFDWFTSVFFVSLSFFKNIGKTDLMTRLLPSTKQRNASSSSLSPPTSCFP